MKKKRMIITICVLILIVMVGIISLTNKSKTFVVDGIKYAVSLDGESVNYFPNKGMYRVDAVCDNAKAKWLYDEWKLAIEEVKGNVSCDLDFVSVETTYFDDYITNLLATTPTQGNGMLASENGIRYQGKNPNNYVWFNNEYWRIIGVFDGKVKIIRDGVLGGLVFDKNNNNKWSSSSLKSLLNEAYYNAEDGTESGNCYGYSTTVTGNCNYTEIGIKDEYRTMIANGTWNVGAGTVSSTAEEMYNAEILATDTGYIGLISASEYGYSVIASDACPRTMRLDWYGQDACSGKSWLYGKGYGITISSVSSVTTDVVYVNNSGNVVNYVAENGYALRPALYLESDVYVLDGVGSVEDPYIIGM